MNLTSFLENKDVRERFRQEFEMPRLAVKKEILAPPLSKRYSLIGTAFDYVLRFYIERVNPGAVTTPWVAEDLITNPLSPLLKDVVIDIDADTGKVSYTETELTRKVRQIIEEAKTRYSEYLSSGQITAQLLASTLSLAQLDIVCRVGRVDENLGMAHEEDIEDLRNLVSIVEPELFRAKYLCLLNPTFGAASHLVGGADADLLIDDTIIDIKTTKDLRLKGDDFNQLMGYFVLHEISGIGGLTPKPKVSKIAIYFSRHAYFTHFRRGRRCPSRDIW
jgi:hypothetical protein